jgi:hypothetical protein
MTDQHPITPPPELVHQWADMLASGSGQAVFAMAAQWGADQELEACCHLLRLQGFDVVNNLRAARRPKPPSLKEQALELVNRSKSAMSVLTISEAEIIRRALEALDD